MTKPKITLNEPDGPLRKGLRQVSNALGVNGGEVFSHAYELANGGLKVVLDLHHKYGIGDPDISIPPPFKAVAIQRERGAFTAPIAGEAIQLMERM